MQPKQNIGDKHQGQGLNLIANHGLHTKKSIDDQQTLHNFQKIVVSGDSDCNCGKQQSTGRWGQQKDSQHKQEMQRMAIASQAVVAASVPAMGMQAMTPIAAGNQKQESTTGND